MAKIVLLLCLTVLLGVVLARERRQDITRGRSFNTVGGQSGRGERGGIRGFRRPMHRFPGRRGEDGGTSNRRWTPRQGPWGDDRRPVGGRGGMAGMSPSMKASDRLRQRLPHNRMVERLRAELSRFHNQRTSFGGQGRDQGQRRYFPNARAAGYDTMGGNPRMPSPRVDPRVDLMDRGRGFTRRHLDNDLRGFGRFGARGDHHPMRMGPGSGPGYGRPSNSGRGGPRFSVP